MVRQVLLVEAEPSARLLQLDVLRMLGYRPRAVGSLPAALDHARRRQPDAILVGAEVGDGGPDRLGHQLKLDPQTNPLALVRLQRPGRALELDIEPDAWLAQPTGRSAVSEALGRGLSAAAERRRDLARSEVRWRLPSDHAALEAFQDQFRDWVKGCGLSPFQGQQLGLAVRELCANAMEWGHGFVRERIVCVAARLDEEKVSVLVRDGGPGFNPRNLRHAARPGDPISHLEVRAAARMREGGFGILMASGLVDHLAYNDAGNEALAIKYLPPLTRTKTGTGVAIAARA
jgi:two-component system OmpR family response regulator